MFERRSLKWPITLGVIMIVLIVALTVGWIMLAVSGALNEKGAAPLYWTLLTVGTTFLVLVLVGVVMYLALSVKEINLNRRQSNFMDAVTHELKSPIASLKLYLQTLHRRQVSEEEQAKFHRYMLEDTRLGLSLLVSVGKLTGVPTPLAAGLLALGTAITGRDLYEEGRTMESLGLADLDIDALNRLLREGL